MTDESDDVAEGMEEAEDYGTKDCSCCDQAYPLNADGETEETSWTTVEDGDEVCDKCIRRNFVYSGPQDEYVSREDAVSLNDTGDHVSQSYAERNCYQSDDGDWYSERPEDDGDLFDYGTDVLEHCAWDQRGARNGALLFGVELEMEPTRRSGQSDVATALGGRLNAKYILKEDGSLDSGVELVTVPLTLDGHRTAFNWDATLRPVQTRAKSGKGTSNCGMHVHINKAALSAFTIGKMLVFLNSPRLEALITTIAQRASNGYCSRSKKTIKDGKWNGDNRYDIANVGPRTVELRLFKGNLRPERVLKNIEFCHAVVLYCRDASMQTLENPEIFSQWLRKRRGEYPELVKFLATSKASYFAGMIRPRKDGQTSTVEEV